MTAAGTRAPMPSAPSTTPVAQPGSTRCTSNGTASSPWPVGTVTPAAAAATPRTANNPSSGVHAGRAIVLRRKASGDRAANAAVSTCGYTSRASADPSARLAYDEPAAAVDGSPPACRKICPVPPSVRNATTSSTPSAPNTRTAFTTEMAAGARSPSRYVATASTANASVSARSATGPPGGTPRTVSNAWIPSSCNATYGIVASIPHTATAAASGGDENRARTTSAGVSRSLSAATRHSFGSTTNAIGYTMTVYGRANRPIPPVPYTSAGTARNV